MSVVAMKKIRICAMKKDRKEVLEYLQRRGVVEIDSDLHIEDVGEDTDTLSGFCRTDTARLKSQYRKRADTADKALEVLEQYVPEKKGFLAGLEGLGTASDEEMQSIIDKRHWFNRMAAGVIANSAKIDACEVEIARCRRNIEGLAPWMEMDIPINTESTKATRVFIGTLPPDTVADTYCGKIDALCPEIKDRYQITFVSQDKDQACIAAICHKSDGDKLENALRETGFVRIAFFSHRTPDVKVKKYNRKIRDNEKEREDILVKFRKYAAYRDTFKILSDYYRIRADKYEVLGSLMQSERTFIITGTCPENQVESIEKDLNSGFNLYFATEDYGKDEPMPVLLDNPRTFAAGEGVMSSYGLPSRTDIDPCAIMTVCYVVLVGMMLSDAAYGLIVFAVCFALLYKVPKMGQNIAKTVRRFVYFGISTMCWGVLFGGYFGDAVTVVARTFMGRDVTVPALWFTPLDQPMKMLVVSLAIGLVHLFLGLGIKGYQLARRHDWVAVISDVLSWYLLIIGLILMLMPTQMFYSITGISMEFSQTMIYASYVIAGLGALIIVFMSGREKKNPFLRVALGLYDLYNVTGWLSDILSYSRLLALGLATGVIAQVINQMGSMAGSGVFGMIVFVLVFIGGHALNMAINILGAYVHTCRLQYVEFFGKFYDGTGKPFKPFRNNTRYVVFGDKVISDNHKEDLVS